MDDHLLWIGAQNTLTVIRDNWADDNDLNREMVEMLLAQAILKTADLEG